MRKIVSFMHVSLDGFVAGPSGEMDWIIVNEEIFDYAGMRTNEANTALYGRVTYDMMDSYWPTAADQPNPSKHDIEHAAWYKKVEKIVLSESMRGQQKDNTTIISEDVPGKVNALKQQEGKEIIIFGSPGATQSLMQYDLVDEFWLFVNPVILGQGIPLFKNVKDKVLLELVDSKAFASSGVVCLHYRVK